MEDCRACSSSFGKCGSTIDAFADARPCSSEIAEYPSSRSGFRELVRQQSRASIPAMWADWRTSFRLWSQNLDASTGNSRLEDSCPRGFVLPPSIGMISPSLALQVANITDVPTALYTEASIKSISPVGSQMKTWWWN